MQARTRVGALLLALSLCLASGLACTRKDAAPAPMAAGKGSAAPAEKSAAAAEKGSAAAAREDALPPGVEGIPDADEVKPVYSSFSGPPLPLARKLCAALHELPAARRAECCKGQPGTQMADECTKIVSGAVRNGAVSLDAAAVDACAAAQAKAFAGCSWVGQWLLPLPPECAGLLRGKLEPGAVCRSSLECGDGLHCDGVGPTDAGRCAPGRPDGQLCMTGVDPLVAYTRANDGKGHDECAGFCGHRQCLPHVAPGAACSFARQCQPGQHCDGKVCVAGEFASAGQGCVGGSCAAGLRCTSGVCKAPKPDGASCANDTECLGGCVPATHQCGMRCEMR